MKLNNQPKIAVPAANTPSAEPALQGVRGATGDAGSAVPPIAPPGADTEVIARAACRKFTIADKRRLLEAVDHCTQSGEIGALMRREACTRRS